MKKGDIVIIPFPFTDLTGNKTRPAIILVENHLDVTVTFISTQTNWKDETDILLQPTPTNGLKKESVVRLSKIATLDKNLVFGLLGRLDDSEISLLNVNLKKLFKID